MSDLNDFFAAQKKKKDKKGKNAGGTKATVAVAPAKETEEQKQVDSGAKAQEQVKQMAFAESSDEETSAVLALDTVSAAPKVKDRKEMEEAKRRQEEEDGAAAADGWSLLDKSKPTEAESLKAGATSKKPGQINTIQFNKGKPTFTKSNLVSTKEDFPEMDFSAAHSKKQPAVGEQQQPKQSDYSGMFSSAKGTGNPQNKGPVEEKKKPMFVGRAKFTTGGATTESLPQRQNYDYSTMGFSAATKKVHKPQEGEEQGDDKDKPDAAKSGDQGNRRPPPRFARAFGDDDFEVVKDKTRRGGGRKRAQDSESDSD